MKKIISIFAVLIVSLTVFCLPTFALESNEKTFTSFDSLGNDCLFNNGSALFYGVSNDYKREPLTQPYVFMFEDNYNYSEFSSFEFRWHTEDNFVNLSSGNILQFHLEDIYSLGLGNMSNNAYVKMHYRVEYDNRYYSDWIDLTTFSFKRSSQWDNDFQIDFDFYYKNDTNHKVTDILFEIGFYSYTKIVIDFTGVEFPQYASNVFNGPSNSPDAPTYKPNTGTINKTDNLKEQEDKLMQDTEEGKEETLSLFQNFGNYLTEFAVPLLAIKGLFDYFVGGTLFEGILLISLTLGLLSFVFNIFPSIQARQNREKRANEKQNKNSQNKGGG